MKKWHWGWCKKATVVSVKELLPNVLWKNKDRVELFVKNVKLKGVFVWYLCSCYGMIETPHYCN